MSDTLSLMIETLKTKFKVAIPLSGETPLYGMGMDSLDVINFLFTIEQGTGVKLPDDELEANRIDTLGQVAAYVDARRA